MNEVFHSTKEYYLSYLETPSELAEVLDRFILDSKGKSTHVIGRSETAICINDPWKCLILYGDHRNDMLPIKDNLDALKQYWLDNKELIGHTSDTLEDEDED